MPTTVQTMIERTAHHAAARAMRETVDETLGGFLRPGVPEGIGFAVGFAILAKGLSVRARQRRLAQIEDKVDQLVENESEQETDGNSAAREERLERRRASHR